jgi:hypothetical protein
MNKVKFSGLRTAFPGTSVFSIIAADLDSDRKSKADEVKILIPARLTTLKTVEVNEVKEIKIAGGRSALQINGGANGMTFGETDKFIGSTDELGVQTLSEEVSKKWFSDYEVAKNLCNIMNEEEIRRLEAIASDIKEQIAALKAVNIANDNAAQNYVAE